MRLELSPNGFFSDRGSSYSIKTYEDLVVKYDEYVRGKIDGTISVREFARLHNVSRKTAKKVKDFRDGTITFFHQPKKKERKINYGKKSFSED